MYGVSRHWHKRLVRAGVNTLQPYRQDAPDRSIGADDIVFCDFRAGQRPANAPAGPERTPLSLDPRDPPRRSRAAVRRLPRRTTWADLSRFGRRPGHRYECSGHGRRLGRPISHRVLLTGPVIPYGRSHRPSCRGFRICDPAQTQSTEPRASSSVNCRSSFFIEHGTRSAHLAGVLSHPTGAWEAQRLRCAASTGLVVVTASAMTASAQTSVSPGRPPLDVGLVGGRP